MNRIVYLCRFCMPLLSLFLHNMLPLCKMPFQHENYSEKVWRHTVGLHTHTSLKSMDPASYFSQETGPNFGRNSQKIIFNSKSHAFTFLHYVLNHNFYTSECVNLGSQSKGHKVEYKQVLHINPIMLETTEGVQHALQQKIPKQEVIFQL